MAFVKAHRLHGDSDSLRSLLYDRFDNAMLSSAFKALWEFCRPDLLRSGLTYQARRSAERRQLFNSIFLDLLTAFDVLDLDNCLPSTFCEANDLILLPTLDPDPVSKQLN